MFEYDDPVLPQPSILRMNSSSHQGYVKLNCIHKNMVSTPERKFTVSFIKVIPLMMYREIIGVYRKTYMKYINTLCERIYIYGACWMLNVLVLYSVKLEG
jgi:hypothetical protein